ncbi:MAG: hypothetical protein V2J02_20305 [Pseudomonadales bacterium]|nr:hypothetical protein [Pseudomonadales bacterium]
MRAIHDGADLGALGGADRLVVQDHEHPEAAVRLLEQIGFEVDRVLRAGTIADPEVRE